MSSERVKIKKKKDQNVVEYNSNPNGRREHKTKRRNESLVNSREFDNDDNSRGGAAQNDHSGASGRSNKFSQRHMEPQDIYVNK